MSIYTIYKKTLRAGELTVSLNDSLWQADAVFDIAERVNPKRAFLFISKVLGHHIAVAPHQTRQVCHDLASQIPDDIKSPVLFIGMAETAVALACAIYQEARPRFPESVLLTTTRHPVDGELLCGFREAHSHATGHLLYYPKDLQLRERAAQAQTVVLIDDETTTGNTLFNLLDALQKKGLPLQQVVTVNLTDWSNNALAKRIDARFVPLCLLSGQWHWQPHTDAPPVVMPHVDVSTSGRHALSARQDWGRLGVSEFCCEMGHHLKVRADARILVVGTEEFVWPPFLLAERLEKDGAAVQFCATTRSPLAQGHAISSVFSFADNYGQSIPHFIYNLGQEHYDQIILCAETSPDTLDRALLMQLESVCDQLVCLYHA
jgi:hypothetical protein